MIAENIFTSEQTMRCSLADIDYCTKLLCYDDDIERALQCTRIPTPEKYQWPIVTALTRQTLEPFTRLRIGLQVDAVPTPIILGFLRDVATYVAERVFTRSSRAWRIVSILEQRAKTVRLDTVKKLEEARVLCDGMRIACQTEEEEHAVAALSAATSNDYYQGARQMCSHVIAARKALRVGNEASIVVALSTKFRRLCELALEQHPQSELLKRKI